MLIRRYVPLNKTRFSFGGGSMLTAEFQPFFEAASEDSVRYEKQIQSVASRPAKGVMPPPLG
jgi:hypothetical protein